jgi:dolichyl-diphosphooligosaccharide--protein glycosyltransferase
MTPRRALFLLGIAAALSIGIALRLSTRPQLTAGRRVHALTVDDNYHLRRARFALAHYPRTILFDPLMNFPQGGVPIWPPLFDAALATPSRILHGAAAPPDTLEREASWVPLFFAAGAIVFSGLFGKQIHGPAAGVAMALFVAACPGHILWTQYGHMDQHVAESFFGLLLVWLFVKSRDRTDGPQKGLEVALGFTLALSVLAWQGAIYWGAIFALSLFLEACLTGKNELGAALRILGLSALAAGLVTLWWLDGFRPPLTYISFGLFQPLFLAALAGGTVLLETGIRAWRGELSRGEIAARVVVGGAAAIAVLPWAHDIALGLARGVGYVVGAPSGEIAGASGYVSYPKDWLKGIGEARPLFADGPGLAARQLSLAFFLAPLAVVWWAFRAKGQNRPGVHIALAVWGAVTLLLALTQRLNVYYAAPLAALTLVEACRLGAHAIGRTAAFRIAVSLGIGAALVAPMVATLPAQVRAVYVPGSDLYGTLDWMGRELPHAVDPYDSRLLWPLRPPQLDRASAVLAPWSLGHLILYEAGLPVVANNFGYGFVDSIRFFLAETEEEGLVIARQHRVRWILATDLNPRLNDYASYIGRPPMLRSTPQGGVNATPRYFSTLQSRLYDYDGQGLRAGNLTIPPLAHFRLIYRSRSAISRGGRWLARWKVFEVVG